MARSADLRENCLSGAGLVLRSLTRIFQDTLCAGGSTTIARAKGPRPRAVKERLRMVAPRRGRGKRPTTSRTKKKCRLRRGRLRRE